jgi:hypothetical protein
MHAFRTQIQQFDTNDGNQKDTIQRNDGFDFHWQCSIVNVHTRMFFTSRVGYIVFFKKKVDTFVFFVAVAFAIQHIHTIYSANFLFSIVMGKKNTTGGNKSKGLARKDGVKKTEHLRVSQNQWEVYAQVIKNLGSMFLVMDVSGREMLCVLPGKFRGRGKRDNKLTVHAWLLVGLRDYEKDVLGKKPTCDLLELYSDEEKRKLRQQVVHINWTRFVVNDAKPIGTTGATSSTATDADLQLLGAAADELIFEDEATSEYNEWMQQELARKQSVAASSSAAVDTTAMVTDDVWVDLDSI